MSKPEGATKTPVTRETPVMVVMKGEQHTFTVGSGGQHSVESWANTLSDLTGYNREFVVREIIKGLRRRNFAEIPTAAGNLCPIRFEISRA
jgi:hypothetical protein